MNRAIGLIVLLAFAGCAGLPGMPIESSATVDASQWLVMLAETAPARFQPGAAGPAGYSSVAARNRSTRLARAIARDHGLRVQSDWLMPALGVRCFVMTSAFPARVDAIAAALAADARVESAQPVQRFVAAAGDPYRSFQSSIRALRLDAVHRMATGKGVTVAQVDTGVDPTHPDLARRVIGHRNFVDASGYRAEVHGTAVAGIIVAERDNDVGMIGVAPDARLLALRACWADPPDAEGASCTSFTLAKALQHALSQRARIINLSLTGPRDRLLERLLDVAAQRGIVLVGAAEDGPAQFPAAHPRVIAVSALPGLAASTIAAPGTNILSTAPSASWGYFSGSSFSTAQVSGVAALLLERSPSLTPESLRQTLAPPAPAAQPALLDACAALARAGYGAGAHARGGVMPPAGC